MSFLYGSPDQIMPLTTALGAIVATALLFYGKLANAVCRLWDRITGKPQPAQEVITEAPAKPKE